MGVQSPKQIHGTLSEKFLIFQKKIKCSKQPKKQNKLNFYFSVSGAPNVRGGSDVWDKVPKKTVFFYTFPKRYYVVMCSLGSEGVIASPREVDSRLDVAFY